MPIETYHDPANGLVIQRFVGDLAAPEWIALQRRLYVQDDLDPSQPVVWDARASAPSSAAVEQAADLAKRDPELWGSMAGGRTAIVTPVDTDLATLAATTRREIRSFPDYRAAVDWLFEVELPAAV